MAYFMYYFFTIYMHLILICLYRLSECSKYFSIPYFNGYSNNLIIAWIPGCSQSINFLIDLNSNKTWFTSPRGQEFNLSNLVNESTLLALEPKDIIEKEADFVFQFDKINNATAINISSIYSKNRSSYYCNFDGAIAFPLHFEDTSKSVLHQMQKQGLINYLSFSLTQRNIYFGGIDQKEIQDRYYSFCNVLGLNNRWDCSISRVIIQNGTRVHSFISSSKQTNGNAHFDAENSQIFAPKEFMDLLVEYFKEFIDSKLCSLLSLGKTRRQLYCREDHATQQGTITFVIQDYSYLMNMDQFWTCDDFDLFCYCDIEENSIDDNTWKFGRYFYLNYIVQFDYEKKRMHFYSKAGVNLINNTSNTHIIIMLYVTSALLIIGFILLLINRKGK